jgi:hypothetical protein
MGGEVMFAILLPRLMRRATGWPCCASRAGNPLLFPQLLECAPARLFRRRNDVLRCCSIHRLRPAPGKGEAEASPDPRGSVPCRENNG